MEVINNLYGMLHNTAWTSHSSENEINFSKTEVKAYVKIYIKDGKEIIEVDYTVVSQPFSKEILFETNSLIELRKWIEEHIKELGGVKTWRN